MFTCWIWAVSHSFTVSLLESKLLGEARKGPAYMCSFICDLLLHKLYGYVITDTKKILPHEFRLFTLARGSFFLSPCMCYYCSCCGKYFCFQTRWINQWINAVRAVNTRSQPIPTLLFLQLGGLGEVVLAELFGLDLHHRPHLQRP